MLTRLLAFGAAVGAVLFAPAAAPAAAAPATPAVPQVPSGPERITSYDVVLDLRDDGSLHVEETIAYNFGANPRHGILRDIDNRQRYDGSRDRVYPVRDVTVSSETAPAEVAASESDGHVHLRIGDPDRVVLGEHTYRIEYTVLAAATRLADHDELYWNAVGPGWSVPVRESTVRLVSDAQVTRTACFAGAPGASTPCRSARAAGKSATYRGGPVATGHALTVVAAFPPGTVAAAAPVLADRMTVRRFLVGSPDVAGPVSAAVVALPALWLFALRRRRGTREAPARAYRDGIETQPPPGLRPALVNTVLRGSFKPVDPVTVLLDLSSRGYLAIRPAGPRAWLLVAQQPADASLRPEELMVLQAAFSAGPITLLSSAGRSLASARSRIRGVVYDEVVAQGWFSRHPGGGRVLPVLLAVVALLAAVPLIVVLGLTGHGAVVGLAVGVAGVLFVLCAVAVPPPRTPDGEVVRSRLLAFRRYLAGIDPGQLPAERRERALGGLLPYAVALGLAPQLAAAFGAAGVVAGGLGFADPMWWSSFSADATRASSPVSSSSGGSSSGGSSGFSSSGSSGGGGGGGGGGSW